MPSDIVAHVMKTREHLCYTVSSLLLKKENFLLEHEFETKKNEISKRAKMKKITKENQ